MLTIKFIRTSSELVWPHIYTRACM